MSDELPPSPVSVLAASAAQTHELYTAYLNAGFTKTQAMQLVCAALQASIALNQPAP